MDPLSLAFGGASLLGGLLSGHSAKKATKQANEAALKQAYILNMAQALHGNAPGAQANIQTVPTTDLGGLIGQTGNIVLQGRDYLQKQGQNEMQNAMSRDDETWLRDYRDRVLAADERKNTAAAAAAAAKPASGSLTDAQKLQWQRLMQGGATDQWGSVQPAVTRGAVIDRILSGYPEFQGSDELPDWLPRR